MNFRKTIAADEPEMNLIPLIDVLLVILIFLAASTSFTQVRQLKVALPEARAEASSLEQQIDVAISREGLYAVNGHSIQATSAAAMANVPRKASKGQKIGRASCSERVGRNV